MEKLKPIKKKNAGRLCCNSLNSHLPFDTVLYMGFGGWSVTKNGELFYMGDNDTEWDKFKTLADIERTAKRHAKDDWRAECFTPLHGETYQRQRGKWVLVDENLGFS